MLDPHFLPATALPATGSDVFGPLQGGERGLWQGRCAVAEYAFDETASLPRWVLPETTEVLVTDHRIVYAYTRSDSPDGREVTSGELRWLWPQHLRVQPGARTEGRSAAAAQIQLVCAASDGSFPALVFAGGELGTVGDADRLANLIRHAIARFRVDNAAHLGLSTPQTRMLSRLLIGPEFSNFQGGEGQTVTLLGALAVHRPAGAEPPADPPHAGYAQSAEPQPTDPEFGGRAVDEPGPAPHISPLGDPGHDSLLLASLHGDLPRPHDLAHAAEVPQPYAWDRPVAAEEPYPAAAGGTTRRLSGYRPGLAADEARALQAVAAEQDTHLTQPDLASRAASLAARVAELVSAAEEATEAAAQVHAAEAQAAAEWAAVEIRAAQARAVAEEAAAERAFAAQAAAEQAADSSEIPTTDLTARAERVRRAAARFAANSARGKAGALRPEQDLGSTSRGNRTY
ncbi:translation initiation factor 2 [Actinoplanes sp. ATCC 53533]|uniref:translation initiation factor 2 n=1 Tax=Actinoplanes sp. ATCC 53533 TaxID=1288362 RepID=UPI000F77B177|nr:translation initiation factor 2 [Actinoplanes sp. ATCC 53533]RSM52415.1 translation initiation factor 2 [Actinoplanes sp. ATCC 53533]